MTIIGLWLPILVSAVLGFIASALIWTVVKWHNVDYRRTADEEAVRAALKGSEPGFYLLPFCLDPSDFNTPDVQKKFEDGPIGYLTIVPNGIPRMGPKLVMMFAYFVVVGIICAYFVSRTAAPGADYLAVFRIAGTVAFIAHSMAIVPESIWFGKPWSVTAKYFVDALVYGLLAGGAFGWLA